jgi:hypothetical protein
MNTNQIFVRVLLLLAFFATVIMARSFQADGDATDTFVERKFSLREILDLLMEKRR